MASLNKVLLIGNLTRDPEVRYLPSGVAVSDMRMAMTDKYKSKSGEWVESTCFIDVVVWGVTAENCGKYLRKGSPAFVEGRLQLDEWKAKDGTNQSKIRVRADRVQFLSSGRPTKDSPDSDPGERAPTAAPDEDRESSHQGSLSGTPGAPQSGEPADDDDLPF